MDYVRVVTPSLNSALRGIPPLSHMLLSLNYDGLDST